MNIIENFYYLFLYTNKMSSFFPTPKEAVEQNKILNEINEGKNQFANSVKEQLLNFSDAKEQYIKIDNVPNNIHLRFAVKKLLEDKGWNIVDENNQSEFTVPRYFIISKKQ